MNAPEPVSEIAFDCAVGARVALAQPALARFGLAAGPLELRGPPPEAPKGGWSRYLSVATEAQ